MTRVQRVASYNVCVDESGRLLVCRLSKITARPGAWTLPGGGIDFGEHPEAGALRELYEETGLVGRIIELLAVDSTHRRAGGAQGDSDYHSVRIVYRTEVDSTDLVFETNESTDLAAWCSQDELGLMDLLELAKLGMQLAFGSA